MTDESKAIGGHARAESLSAEERKAIARNAAKARWDTNLLQTEYEGEFNIGATPISCAVLPNGKRLITQSAFLKALGRSRSPKAGTGILSTVDGLPTFLQAEALKHFISDEIKASTTPIFYRTKEGIKGVGYDAVLLQMVAEVYLKFRDDSLENKKSIPKTYLHIFKASDILMRGLAKVGIIALVDEATGYQRDRAKDALQKILEQFIAKELRPWVHTFPDEFYENLFRLRGLFYPKDTVKRPRYFGVLTNNIIYARLAPAILEALKSETPRDEKGRHKHQFHRRLTAEIGHPKLREHLASVITLMKISENYKAFEKLLDRVHPKYQANLMLPFDEKENSSGL
jgi:hypothetical protein